MNFANAKSPTFNEMPGFYYAIPFEIPLRMTERDVRWKGGDMRREQAPALPTDGCSVEMVEGFRTVRDPISTDIRQTGVW